jgi:hypothetical protein
MTQNLVGFIYTCYFGDFMRYIIRKMQVKKIELKINKKLITLLSESFPIRVCSIHFS